MRHVSLLVAIGVATVSGTLHAQQAGSKSDWIKPTSPRASVTHGGGTGGGGAPTPQLVTTAVGGSDNCTTPDVIVGPGPHFFDNQLATTGTQGQSEPLCLLFGNTAILNDVWFTWTAPFTGIARVSTCGIGNGIDTKIAVYNGSGCPASPAIGCNDDACPTFESTVDVNVVSGQAYTIQLGLYPGGGATPGIGSLTIVPISPPAEDSCATPTVIAGPGIFGFDNTLATTGTQGQNESACLIFGNTTVRNDVWYRWTSTFTGTARLDTCNLANRDTKVAVYAGASCPSSPALDCDDDTCPTFESQLVWPVVNGQTYMIQLGLYPGGNPPAQPGSGSFSIQQFVGLPNDECTGALNIVGAGPHGYDTTNATTGTTGQNNVRCEFFNVTAIAADLWYRWTASSTGWVAVNTCLGGTHDLKVAVYQGGGCPTGEPLSCDDDACGTVGASSRAAFLATAGQQYLIQIGSYLGQLGGPGFFTIDPFTPSAGDDCAAPIVISGLGPFAWDNLNATTGTQGQNQAVCANEPITFDIWYRWTSNCTGAVTVTLCGGPLADTIVAVHAGSACPVVAPIACDDDGCGPGVGVQSVVTFNAVSGQTYMIQLGLWAGDIPTTGSFQITTSCPPSLGLAYCFGDGTATACPCGNVGQTGNGCANSLNANGANLAATGVPSISADTVDLLGSGMPNSSALYFQGTTQQNGGLGSVFGDGLRCAGGSVIRLGTKTNVGGQSQYPVGADLPVSVRGNVVAPGTRTYQCWYRNAAAFCTASTFNLSNGMSIAWQP